jgi:hypothetical protein
MGQRRLHRQLRQGAAVRVIRLSASSAPSARNCACAAAIAGTGGGSIHAMPAGSPAPHCASVSASGARSEVRISGGSKAGRPAWAASSHKR